MARKVNIYKKRYEEHATKNSIGYWRWYVRVRDWEDWEKALIRQESKYTWYCFKPYKESRGYIKREKDEQLTYEDRIKNIVSNREEYLVILKAYQNQINSYDLEDKEQCKLKDNLEKEMNNFIRESIIWWRVSK